MTSKVSEKEAYSLVDNFFSTDFSDGGKMAFYIKKANAYGIGQVQVSNICSGKSRKSVYECYKEKLVDDLRQDLIRYITDYPEKDLEKKLWDENSKVSSTKAANLFGGYYLFVRAFNEFKRKHEYKNRFNR